jgi:3-phosphoshikimate 1-carboxyvinyltransferase
LTNFPHCSSPPPAPRGITVLTGAEELRVKESDRIQVMADGLTALGIAAGPTTDGIVIRGGTLSGGTVDSHGDHRIAMSFAMAALRSRDPVSIRDCANVNTSFPDFVALARIAGLNLAEREVA